MTPTPVTPAPPENGSRTVEGAVAIDRPTLGAAAVAPGTSAALPAWCPDWAERLGDAYLSGTSCVFLLHGNVRDAVPIAPSGATPDAASWGSLPEFLAREIFGRWDVVLGYDVGRGLRPLAGNDPARLRTMAQWLSERLGNASGWPREPEAATGAIRRGQLESAPMGYLICGPVGTGKSFIAECYAGSVGIPCAVLKNFRSKYVGETEGNLEHALDVLRGLGPVVVILDEADAALGNREQGGDSGTSARVFSMIARQMGDTRYRGKIVWMLLTSRPDLLPIDLKRQGRAEVHIPLFYPHDQAEIDAMFAAMARKSRVRLAAGLPGPVDLELGLSGADIESVVLAARRRSLERANEAGVAAPEEIGADDLRAALDDFMPSAQGLEKEMQEIAAVLECTERRFLPEHWREVVGKPGGRARLQERLAAIREVISS